MLDKKERPVPFKRYVDKDATSRKWSEPLDDQAYEVDMNDIWNGDPGTGDLFSYDEGHKWWEIIQRRVDRDDRDGSIDRIMYLINPVDEFGNKLTKTQIAKKYPQYQYSFEKYGFCTYYEIRSPEEEHEWLVVPTTYTMKQDQFYNDIEDEMTRRPYHNGSRTIFDVDDWGRHTPTEEFLKEHPEWDPDVDSLDDKYAKKVVLPYQGNAETRANFKKANDARKAKLDAADKRIAARDEAHKYLFNYGSLSSDFEKLQPDVSKKDMEKMKYNVEAFAYAPYGDKPDFENRHDFKKWVDNVGGDWSVVSDAISQGGSGFSHAMVNSYMANN